MTCPNCSGEIPSGARYCPYCNTYIGNTESSAAERDHMPPYRQTELKRIKAQKAKRNRRAMLIILPILLLCLIVFGVFFGIKSIAPKKAEITTEPPTAAVTTTVPATEATTVTVTDHFAQAKENFYSMVAKFSGFIGDPIGEFSLSDNRPDTDAYGDYAYIGNNYPDYVFVFTGSQSSEHAKLKRIYGELKDLLPGRSNYTYHELQSILGDHMSAKEGSDGNYIFTYHADGCRIVFYGPYLGSLDAGLDKFRLESSDTSSEDQDETTLPNTTSAEEEKIKNAPEEYFAGTPRKKYTVQTEGDKLNLRSFAGTDQKIIGTIPNQETLTVYGFYNGWAYIQTADGEKGWVYADYLESADD